MTNDQREGKLRFTVNTRRITASTSIIVIDFSHKIFTLSFVLLELVTDVPERCLPQDPGGEAVNLHQEVLRLLLLPVRFLLLLRIRTFIFILL